MEELKEGWRRVKLGEISTFLSGYAFKGSLFSEEGHKVIKIKNVNGKFVDINNTEKYPKELCEKLAKYKIKNNDILIAMTGAGSVGRVSKFKYKGNNSFYINQRVGKIIIDSEKANSEFIFQIISTQKYEKILFDMANGSGQPNLSPKLISEVEIELPPLETQEKIASILSALDDKIEINNEMNKTLEEMAQTLFKRWFIDFDFPNENGEPYRSSGGKMVDSELGEIPEGWEIEKLSKIIEINPKESLKKGGKSIYLEMKSLSENSSIISNYIVRDFTGSGTKFRNRDTLMARITPCLENGKTGFINFLDNEIIAWGSTEFNILRSKKNIPKELSYFIARDQNFRKYAIGNMNGSSGRQRISGKILEEYKLAIPNDFNLYQRFGFVISKLMNKIESNRKEIQSLTEIRDTLLPKLMSGEIEV